MTDNGEPAVGGGERPAAVVWDQVSDHMLAEMQRQAEIVGAEQRDIATSIDQRAGAVVALSTAAVVAVVAAFMLRGEDAPAIGWFVWPLAAAIGGWVVSAAIAVGAMSPQTSEYTGTWPFLLYEHVGNEAWSDKRLLGALIERLNDRLDQVHTNNESRLIWLWWSLRVAAISPLALLVGAVVALVNR